MAITIYLDLGAFVTIKYIKLDSDEFQLDRYFITLII